MTKDYLNLTPVEITEADFDSAFKSLPPTQHTVMETCESFFFGDIQTENIYLVYARIFNRFFKLYATEDENHYRIISRIMTAWSKGEITI